jgi:diguanylate cyclase (GGDEF)-like protein/PAS domain S-box-containing protein
MLKIPAQGLPVVHMGDSSRLEVGECGHNRFFIRLHQSEASRQGGAGNGDAGRIFAQAGLSGLYQVALALHLSARLSSQIWFYPHPAGVNRMDTNVRASVSGGYEKLSDEALQVEFERVTARLDEPGATVFSRMLRELHAHQIELEMQHRELLKVHQQLEETRDQYFSLNELAALSYFSFDRDGAIREVNLAGSSLVHTDRSALIGMPFAKFVAAQDRDRFLQHVHRYIAGKVPATAEFLLELPDGQSIEVQMTCVVAQPAGSKEKYCRTVLTDITERRQIERKLQLSEKALHSIEEGVMLTDAQFHIIAVNPAFSRMTGYSAEEAIGRTPALLKSGFHNDEFYRAIYDALKKHDGWQGEIRNRRKNGEMHLEWLNISVIRNYSGEADYYIGVLSDITSQDQFNKHLHQLAYYDELTGLPNRNLLYDRLLLELVHSKRTPTMMALLFIDLDGFKEINDQHGHLAGDQLLVEVSKRLLSCAREGDTVSRLGGDEFVALLRDIADEHVAAQVAGRMLEACAEPIVTEGNQQLFVTASIGISISPRDGDNRSDLLRNADVAMYRAKSSGKNGYEFFSTPAVIA